MLEGGARTAATITVVAGSEDDRRDERHHQTRRPGAPTRWSITRVCEAAAHSRATCGNRTKREGFGPPFFCVPSMTDGLEVQVLHPARWRLPERARSRKRRRQPGEASPRTDEACDAFPGSGGHLARLNNGGPPAHCGLEARAPREASRRTWLNCKDDGASRSPGRSQVGSPSKGNRRAGCPPRGGIRRACGEVPGRDRGGLPHRIREAWMPKNGGTPYSGPVEVDETCFGGKRKNMSNAKRKELADTGQTPSTRCARSSPDLWVGASATGSSSPTTGFRAGRGS